MMLTKVCPLCGNMHFEEAEECYYCKKPLDRISPRGSEKEVGWENSADKFESEYLSENIFPYPEKRAAYKNMLEIKELENQVRRARYTAQPNTPKCPTCGSTSVSKIGGVERGASVLTLGIFSKKINKSFKCKSCGHTW